MIDDEDDGNGDEDTHRWNHLCDAYWLLKNKHSDVVCERRGRIFRVDENPEKMNMNTWTL